MDADLGAGGRDAYCVSLQSFRSRRSGSGLLAAWLYAGTGKKDLHSIDPVLFPVPNRNSIATPILFTHSWLYVIYPA